MAVQMLRRPSCFLPAPEKSPIYSQGHPVIGQKKYPYAGGLKNQRFSNLCSGN